MQPLFNAVIVCELAEVFRRHDASQPLGLIAPIGRPTIFTGSKSALEMATADQSLSQMAMQGQSLFMPDYAR